MPKKFPCIAAPIVRTPFVTTILILEMTALSERDRLLLLPGEEAGTAGHPVKVETDAVVMD